MFFQVMNNFVSCQFHSMIDRILFCCLFYPEESSARLMMLFFNFTSTLLCKCYFGLQVFTFGSVPLKTYLPDGDIDLTAFSKNQTLKETWAHQVRDMLENEEKNENAEFHVKEVQYIQAEVCSLIRQYL